MGMNEVESVSEQVTSESTLFAKEMFSAIQGSVNDRHKDDLFLHLETFARQLGMVNSVDTQRKINAEKKLCKEFFITYACARFDYLYLHTFKRESSSVLEYVKKVEKVEFAAKELGDILAALVAEDRFVEQSLAAREAITDALRYMKVPHRDYVTYFAFKTKSGVNI